MLRRASLFGMDDKVKRAILLIQEFEGNALAMNSEGYYVAFSGGKDSIVLLDLVKKAGVKYKAYYNITTVDPPELVKFIKKNHPDVIRIKPPMSMWKLIVQQKIPPNPIMRYCCRILKELGGGGKVLLTGIRWEESSKRKSRRMVEPCQTGALKFFVHPIINWTDKDVWQYIQEMNLLYCSLYDEGWKRIGCIGCPLATKNIREKEFKRYPGIKAKYIKAFEKMLEYRKTTKSKEYENEWKTGEDVFNWWMNVRVRKIDYSNSLFHIERKE